MPVNNTDVELVQTRSPIEIAKIYSQPDTITSYYSSSTPRTDSTSEIYPTATLPAALIPSSKSHKMIESLKEGVQKMRSECAASESAFSTSSGINSDCYLSSKIPKEIVSMQEGVNKLCSESESSIYFHIKLAAQPYDYIISIVNI